MKILYIDCFAGISGDMLLGALADLGIPLEELQTRLDSLGLEAFRLTSEKVLKNGISATKVRVTVLREQHQHRHLSHILELIFNSTLPDTVKEKAALVFRQLAEAEARIHGVSVEKVHFHEVGAADAIVDIVGTVTALDMLNIDRVYCSPLPLGTGFVECAHGILPLPAPAVLELLKGIPVRTCDIQGETVTPTGAALAAGLSENFGPMTDMTILATGYGAGTADRKIPNLLRLVLGETTAEDPQTCELNLLEKDRVVLAEANLDDMNPEMYDYIIPLLLQSGALDAFITPVLMKKGRPAHILSCLVEDRHLEKVVMTILKETTSLGVRTRTFHRYKLSRRMESVNTPYGPVNIKLGLHPQTGAVFNIAPEWEDCKRAAERTGVPVKTVYDLAKSEAYKQSS